MKFYYIHVEATDKPDNARLVLSGVDNDILSIVEFNVNNLSFSEAYETLVENQAYDTLVEGEPQHNILSIISKWRGSIVDTGALSNPEVLEALWSLLQGHER